MKKRRLCVPGFHWLTHLSGLLGGLLALVVFSSTAVAQNAPPPSLLPLDVLAAVQVGRHPSGVAVYSNPMAPSQTLAVVANRNSSTISVVDLLNLSKLSEFEVGKYPTGVA